MSTATASAKPLLFQPLTIRGVTFKNRLVVAPMVHYRAGPGNTCGTFHTIHLGRYALGGFGAVMTEASAVEERGLTSDKDMGLYNEAQAESFKPFNAFMKEERCVSIAQLAHAGRKAGRLTIIEGSGAVTPAQVAAGRRTWHPVAPSAIPVGPEYLVPHTLTAAEVKGTVEAFAAAAKRAVRAGFDAVEIHGAHGYLIATFLSPVTNTRNDQYGGDIKGRMRFPLEITEAVRAVIPEDMPLFFRVSSVDGTQEGWQIEDTVLLAKELKARGVDVVDCSSGGLMGTATAAPVSRSLGFQVPFADRVRNEAGVKSMAVGLILSGQQAEKILQNGQADLIAVGRQAQYNPNVANHWAHEIGLNERFELWDAEFGWWLEKRVRTMQEFATPTGQVFKHD